MRDRLRPNIYDAITLDRGVPLLEEAAVLAAADLQRWSRRYLLPVVAPICNLVVWLIVLFKKMIPIPFRSHGIIDWLGIWFLRHFVSVEGCQLLMRHFIVETNLINFVAVNSRLPSVQQVDLRPVTLDDMGNSAVVVHDLNIYNLMLDIGEAKGRGPFKQIPLDSLDFSMLEIPEIDGGLGKWLKLDLGTGICFMIIVFCLFTTLEEYERAVNSFQLDESLLGHITDLTGDPAFRSWTPKRFLVWPHITRNTPRELYQHAVVNEFAYGRLVMMHRAVAANDAWPVMAAADRD